MANIRVDVPGIICNGQAVTFKSPANCSQVTGLRVYYKDEFEEFQFADAHGNNVGNIDLFAANVLVKVILDTELHRAYVQNADTNAYLEEQLASKAPLQHEHSQDATTRVGDIIETVRTELNDNWLECDGSAISGNDYPELFSFDVLDIPLHSHPGTPIGYMGVDCYNKTWVSVGGSTLAISTDPILGDLVTKTVSGMDGNCVCCYNGRWIVGGGGANSVTSHMFTATDPKGTWTKINVSMKGDKVVDIKCYNGTWVAITQDDGSTNGYIYTTKTPTGSWTEVKLTEGSAYSMTLTSVACNDGKWVIVGYNKSDKYSYIFTASNPAGTWTMHTVDGYDFLRVRYHDGKWIATGRTSNTPYSACVFTATSPGGVWTKNTVQEGASQTDNGIYDICYDYGKLVYVAAGKHGDSRCLYESPDLVTWTSHTDRLESASSAHILRAILYSEDMWVAVGYAGWFCSKRLGLPKLTGKPVRKYIKAK